MNVSSLREDCGSKIANAIAAKPNLEARTCFQLACGYALCAGAVAKGRPVGSLSADEAATHRRLINRAYDRITVAQAANEWDMDGHAEKAKALLEQAKVEIGLAAEAANHH